MYSTMTKRAVKSFLRFRALIGAMSSERDDSNIIECIVSYEYSIV